MSAPSDAALIDDLTTIVSRAAAAILAVARERARYAHQGRPVAGDRGRRGRRSHHPRRAGAAAAGRAGRFGRGPGPRRHRLGRKRVHPGRSARRHPRIGGRPRRIHRQSRARAGGLPALGIVAAPALGTGLARRPAAARNGCGLPPAPRPTRPPTSRRSAPGPCRRPASSRRSAAPISTRRPRPSWPGSATSRRLDQRLGDQILPGRRRRADVYPRLAPTSNGTSRPAMPSSPPPAAASPTPDGKPLIYRPDAEGFRVPGFIAWGDPTAVDAGR